MTKAMWIVSVGANDMVAAFDREADAWAWVLDQGREWNNGVPGRVSGDVASGRVSIHQGWVDEE